MAVTWENVRALGLFFGPMLIPKAISFWRSMRSASARRGIPIQPIPTQVQSALAVVFVLAVSFLIKSLPYFGDENIFAMTESRLQAPVDVLFNRLARLRPNNQLTETDQALRGKFVNLESRLLYLQFGPEVLAECRFCSVDEPRDYLFYALTSLMWPHIVNLIVLSITTSPSWTGRYGSQWRTTIVLVSGLLCALDIYLLSAYNHGANARALRLESIDFFHWKLTICRYIALATIDAAFGLLLWLSSTNRAFVQLPSHAERINDIGRMLCGVHTKMHALGIIKNTTARDEELRAMNRAYWNHEAAFMGEVMEEREVLEGIKDALSNRIDITNISKEAEQYANDLTGMLGLATEGMTFADSKTS